MPIIQGLDTLHILGKEERTKTLTSKFPEIWLEVTRQSFWKQPLTKPNDLFGIKKSRWREIPVVHRDLRELASLISRCLSFLKSRKVVNQ